MTAVLDARVPDLLDDLVRTAPPAPPTDRIEARARVLDISARLYLLLRWTGTAMGLWITRHGLVAEAPAGADIYGHVVRTDFALHELFLHGRLDGWFPGFGSGYRLFAVNGPGLAIAAGMVRVASLGTVDTARSFALLGAVSIAALPWAVARLSRELGATRLAAAVHGLLALFVSFYAGGGLAGLYGPGLIAQSIALPLQIVTLALVIRAVRHGGRRPIATAALSVAMLALLHPISILVLALFAPLGVGREWFGAPVRRLVCGAAVAAWAMALAGFWLVPAMQFAELRGVVTSWLIPPLPTRLGEVVRGDVLLPRAVAFAVVAAALVTVVQALVKPSRWRRFHPFLAAMAFLTAAHLAVGHGIEPHELMVQFPTRGLALAAILALQPLAELIGDGVSLVRRRRLATQGQAIVPALAAVGLALCVPWQLDGLLDPRQVATPPSVSLEQAAVELERLVPPMGRHLLVIPAPTTSVGTDNPSRWLTVASGTNSAHLYFWEATRENTAGVLAADLLGRVEPADALETLRRTGVTHVVTTDIEQAPALLEVEGFHPIWTDGGVTIHEVLPAAGRPSPAALLQPAAAEPLAFTLAAAPMQQEAERLAWEVETDVDLAAVAAVAYDPDWKATIDGRPVATERSAEGLVQLDLPAGDHQVTLRFTGARADPLGLALTLVGLLTVLALRRPSGGRSRRFRTGGTPNGRRWRLRRRRGG